MVCKIICNSALFINSFFAVIFLLVIFAVNKLIMKKLAFVKNHLFGVCVVLFLLFMGFFDDHSYLQLQRLRHQQSKIEAEIASYRDSIAEYEEHIKEVSGNGAEMEKFAREKLMMKKVNEDVYIIK